MPNEIQSRLAENIKKIRKAKKITQFELAEKADISEAMVKSIETCHSWPSEKTLLQISEALETDVFYFFMPVAGSVRVRGEIENALKCVIKENYRLCVQELLKTLE